MIKRRFLNLINKAKNNLLNSYFTIEALEDGLTAKLSNNACEYCVDNGEWESLAAGTNTETINTGQTLSFRASLSSTNNGIGTFTISKKCNLKGNIMSLLYSDDFIDKTDLIGKNDAFYNLFYNCTNIVDASELVLPATTLANYCYGNMFKNCTSLTTAPELPARFLKYDCYYMMFYGCKNLNYIKMLASDISSSSWLTNWVFGVSSTGTFVKNANMTSLPSGTSGIPSGWAVQDYVVNIQLINFTINGNEYQAEEGITWEDFINSKYNFDKLTTMGVQLVYYNDLSSINPIYKDDIILNNTNYTFSRSNAPTLPPIMPPL